MISELFGWNKKLLADNETKYIRIYENQIYLHWKQIRFSNNS